MAGLWWWSGTQASLDWALSRLARDQAFTVDQPRGALRTGLRLERLAWERDGLKVEARGVELAWQPLALLGGRLRLDHLRALSVRIEDRRPPSADPARTPPQSLALPLPVTVAEIKVGRAEWVASSAFEAASFAGNYSFDGTAHQLRVDGVRVLDGTYAGTASIVARGEMPLALSVQGRLQAAVPGGGTSPVPLAVTGSLRGPLADLQALVVVDAGTPQATVTARITAFAAQPVPEARAQLRRIDLSAFLPQAPRSDLAGEVRLTPQGTATWSLTADLRNALPGPWDRQRLPIESLQVEGDWKLAGEAIVRKLEARGAGGQVSASGNWKPGGAWAVATQIVDVDPAALHTAMASLPVGGRAEVRGEDPGPGAQAVAFDIDLRAAGAPAPARRATVPGAGAELGAQLRALELRDINARGRWQDGRLALPQLRIRTSEATLQGALQVQPARKTGGGQLSLEAPGLQARFDGDLAERSGNGTLRFNAASLAQAQRWLQRLPGAPAALREWSLGGRGEGRLSWQGGWLDPAVQASVSLPVLDAAPGGVQSPGAAYQLRDAQLVVEGRLSAARVQLRSQGQAGARRFGLALTAQGGRDGNQSPPSWRGQVDTLQLAASDPGLDAGTLTFALRKPVTLQSAPGSFEAGAGEADLSATGSGSRTAPASGSRTTPVSPAVLAWDPVRWRTGELKTAGRLSGLTMGWLELLGGPQLAGSSVSADMVFDAQWDASLGSALRVEASLARTRGDLMVLAETAEGTSARVPAGVREASVRLSSDGDALNLALRWESERAGSAEGRIATRLTRGGTAGWEWPESAPLSGTIKAQLPKVGVWSLLAPPGWRLRGSLGTDIALSGTRGDPQLSGRVQADDMALRSVVDGIELQDGRLRARLEGRRLVVEEFLLRGPGASPAGGTLRATGEGSWTQGGPQLRMNAVLDKLRASVRADRQLTVSGEASAQVDSRGVKVDGKLKVDQAYFSIPDEAAPTLGADVVVRRNSGTVAAGPGPKVAEPVPAPGGRALALAVDLDLGPDFRVQGRGIDTRLRGTLAITAQTITEPRLTGVITTSGGEYRAYGQRLDVERGVIRFTGPPDNPALDILAIRPNLVQRVGVQISGRAQSPFVRLYAEPELADAEKLSWLVLGRASASGGAEAALLQQAALALLAARSGGSGKGLAATFGLDELSFRRDGADGPAITLGKRFASNFYAAYERSLSGALGTLYVFYDLSRRLTVRGQTGERTAVDLIYTFSYN